MLSFEFFFVQPRLRTNKVLLADPRLCRWQLCQVLHGAGNLMIMLLVLAVVFYLGYIVIYYYYPLC